MTLHPVARKRPISQELQGVLSAMLHYDPRQRPTISTILQTPILQGINTTITFPLQNEIDSLCQRYN